MRLEAHEKLENPVRGTQQVHRCPDFELRRLAVSCPAEATSTGAVEGTPVTPEAKGSSRVDFSNIHYERPQQDVVVVPSAGVRACRSRIRGQAATGGGTGFVKEETHAAHVQAVVPP